MSKFVPFQPSSAACPAAETGTVRPNRRRNDELRAGRKHLTPQEVDRILKAAKRGRHGARDALMIRIGYLHGLRVSELVGLRWDQVDFEQGLLRVERLKNGTPSMQPLCGVELRTLRKMKRDYPASPFVFQSERGGPISTAGFRKLFARLGEKAALPWPINPHMLRHSTGYALVNRGDDTRAIQGFLGHKNIRHTQAYTELSAKRFQAMGLGRTLTN